MLRRTTSSDCPNSFSTSIISAVMIDDAMATTKQVNATTIVHHHLYAFDQFFGVSGSLGTKVTSLYSGFPFSLLGIGITPDSFSVVYSSRFASTDSVRYGRLISRLGSRDSLRGVS